MSTTTTTDVAGEYRLIELAQLHESPLNPRKTFNPAAMAELTASVRAKGVITPLLVRPNAKGFEIAAGHRRYRAAKAAEVLKVPAIVRPMDEKTFLEILVMENDEREDLQPLEEAEGYRTLMQKAGYTVDTIAQRKGCSPKYVYDRVKLLQLIPAAKKLLADGTITAGHGILLARLAPKDQERAIDVEHGGLLEGEHVLDPAEGDFPETDPLKPRSVRELQAWIDEHVRFAAAPTAVDPMVFPEAAQVLTKAAEVKEKVIHITHDHHVPEDARDGTVRTFSPMSWERADGKHGSKTCEYSLTGVIVVGPGRGDAFKVCTEKEKCKTHWAKWQKDRAGRARARTSPAAGRKAEDSWEARQKKRDAEEARCTAVLSTVFKALAEKVKKAAAGVKGPLGQVLLHARDQGEGADYMPLGTSAEDLVRFLAFDALTDRPDTWQGLKQFTADMKPFGIDVKKILAEADKAAKKETEAKFPGADDNKQSSAKKRKKK